MINSYPKIYLFKTLNNYYFYEVYNNEIVKIEKSLYDNLYMLIEGKIQEVNMDDDIKKQILELKNSGYLNPNNIISVENVILDDIEEVLDRCVDTMVLQVTQNCNFRCSYCTYTQNDGEYRIHSSKCMNFETAKRAVDFLYNHSIDRENISISFYGGEPLLEFKLIQKVIEYAKDLFIGKHISFSMTTNSTLLSDEIIEYFQQNDVRIMISLDGSKENHDKNRVFASNKKGTYDVVYNIIKKIKTKYPEYMNNVSINMVIDPSIDCKNTIKMLNEDDTFSGIDIRTGEVSDSTSKIKNIYTTEYLSANRYMCFLSNLSILGRIDNKKMSSYSKTYIEEYKNNNNKLNKKNYIPEVSSHGGLCVVGKRKLFINVDGDFFPCEKVNERAECVNIGNLDDGFYVDKVKDLMSLAKYTEEECKNCWAINFCSICAMLAGNGKRIDRNEILNNCIISKARVDSMLKDYAMYKEYVCME